MQPIVECVPNFSNGRDPEVYNRIADTIRAVAGVSLLDLSADPDHNRTVITFVGDPDSVAEAAFQAIATAAELINLDTHEGEHPRIGATDVCPFIPVRDISLQDCAGIAQRLGRRVGEELGIAVYLYGAAATRPERESLSSIRRGEYERWKEEVATDPNRAPDFGPAEPRTWGATVIGARPFLIAYNLYLNTDDVAVAKSLAKAVRYSSGGLRYVQAAGFLVEGQAQVSMNLTDFERTPIHRVQEMVRREAAQHGYAVTKAEIVGLIPQTALLDSARWYLQLADMNEDQVLEIKLAKTASDGQKPEMAEDDSGAFVEAVAAATPTPGGGSASAYVGALGAALAQMVAGLTAGRKRYESVSEQARQLLDEAGQVKAQLAAAVEEDAAAFAAVMAAMRNKDLSDEDRAAAIESATIVAGEVPLRVAQLSLEAARIAHTLATIGNVNAVSDAVVGVFLARAAAEGAALNVRINGASLQDQTLAADWTSAVEEIQAEVNQLAASATSVAAERGGF